MSLLLSGAKTVTIAGTEMQCIEIYTGESYTFPFSITDGDGNAVNCSGWTLSTEAKWYTCNISYPTPGLNNLNQDEIVITDISLDSPQPSSGASANLTAAFTSASTGEGYLYIPVEISGGYGTPNPSPTPAVDDVTSVLVIVTLGISRTNATSSLTDVSREPFGMIVRYQ